MRFCQDAVEMLGFQKCRFVVKQYHLLLLRMQLVLLLVLQAQMMIILYRRSS